MRLDVSGGRPWPGERWDSFRVVLHGSEGPNPYGIAPGVAASYSPDGMTRVIAFGMGRIVTPPGRQARRELTELRIRRVEVSVEGSLATLVLEVPTDRVHLEVGAERRQSWLRMLLHALPLVQEPPLVGRPLGSRQIEDVGELRRQIGAAVSRLRADGSRVSWNAVADVMEWEPSALRKKAQSYGITHPSLLP